MPNDTQSLESLIAASADSDHASFALLFERTHRHLFGVALRILVQHQVAEDVLQEAYVSIWKNAGTYRTQVDGQTIQAMTWLIAIVRNKALDALRLRTRRKENALPEMADGTDAGDAETSATHSLSPSALQLLEDATRIQHIDGCMAALEGSYRQSLALAYYQGLSHTEVAEQLGAPLGTVKTWIRRGLTKLKDCLDGRGVMA